MISSQALCARRLQLLLGIQGVQISYICSLRLTFAGLFATNFLPSTVGGDLVKILSVSRAGNRTVATVTSVAMDRIINFFAVACLLPSVASLGGIEPLPIRVPLRLSDIIAVACGAAVVGAIGILVLLVVRNRTRCRPQQLMSKSPLWLKTVLLVREIFFRNGIWVRRPWALLVALFLSWSSILLSVTAVWIVARAVGIALGPVEITAVVVLIYFVELLPVSFNGLGIQEIGLVYLLSKLGATTTEALSLAVMVRLLYIAMSLIGALGSL